MQTNRDQRRREIVELIDRIRTGTDREESFRLLFERYYRWVMHYFAERGVPPADQEDLTQETFVAVYRGLPRFRGEGRFDTWLLSIARRIHAGEARRAIARRERLSLLPSPGEPPAGDLPVDAVALDRRRQLDRTLAEMPLQMQQCATLRLMRELKYREIAEELEISEDAVRVQLARARKRLRRALESPLRRGE